MLAAGAAAGTAAASTAGAITPMGWLMAGSSVLGSALRPAGAGPSSADSIFSTPISFDQGMWNVAFPGSKISADLDKTNEQAGAAGSVDPMLAYMPYVLGLAALVLLWKAAKR